MNRTAIFALTFLLALIPELFAQDHHNIEQISQFSYPRWDGDASAIVKSGDLAYVAVDSVGLKIVDVSDPFNLMEVGSLEIAAVFYDIAVSNGYGFLTAGIAGLIIIDLSNPANPQIIGGVNDIGIARGVDCDNEIVYIAQGREILQIDCTNPAQPRITARIESNDYALKVKVWQNYLLVAAREGGLEVFDIEADLTRIASVAPCGETFDLSIEGDYVYLAESEAISQIDLRDPEHPVRSVSRPLDSPAVAIATQNGGVFASLPVNSQVAIFDANDNLDRLAEIELDAIDIAADRQTLYLATGNSAKLSIHDISELDNPLEISKFGGFVSIRGVGLCGDYLFAAESSNRLRVFDLSDSTCLIPLRFASEPRGVGSQFKEVILRDTLLFVLDEYLTVFDVTDPASPEMLSELLVGDLSHHLYVDGRRAYCQSFYSMDIEIIDISNPRDIQSNGTIPNPGSELRDFQARDETGFIADRAGSIYILDIAVPENARLLNRIVTRGEPWSIELADNRLYVSSYGSFEVFDVADPTDVRSLGSIFLDGDDPEATIVGDYAFLALYSHGIKVINIADPANMKVAGFFNTEGLAYDLAVAGSRIYVADEEGIGVYDCSEALDVSQSSRDITPMEYRISAYPNPFNSTTNIRLALPEKGTVTIFIFDGLGREVGRMENPHCQAGYFTWTWNSSSETGALLPSGIYLCSVEFTGASGKLERSSVKLTLLR